MKQIVINKQLGTQKIGLGTAAIGRPQYINIRNQRAEVFSLPAFKAKAIQVLESAYEQGIHYFDTAPGYGLAEQLLIDWVKTKNDPKIEVATKWAIPMWLISTQTHRYTK